MPWIPSVNRRPSLLNTPLSTGPHGNPAKREPGVCAEDEQPRKSESVLLFLPALSRMKVQLEIQQGFVKVDVQPHVQT